VREFLRVHPGFDVAHVHNIHTYLTYQSLSILKVAGLPVILTVHDVMPAAYTKFEGMADPSRPDQCSGFDYRVNSWGEFRRQKTRYFPFRNRIIRHVLRRDVDILVTPSQAMLDFLHANRVDGVREVVIPNGIETANFEVSEAEKAAFRRKHDLEGRGVMLFAGRLSREKGADQVMALLEEVVKVLPETVLLILARPGPASQSVLTLAESRGLGQTIRFAGWLDGRELSTAIAAADLCLLPSVCFENFPTITLEAGAAGTPVISTCFGGAPESIIDGDTGYVVNPFNVPRMSQLAVGLLSDQALRTKMGEAARLHIRLHYDWENFGARLVALYETQTK
jgi:glycosyltransferase involved in cell wall biosynthesis